MSIIVTATFVAAPGRRDDLIAALATATAEVHSEEGCEFYALHDAADGTVWFIEKWTTEEALSAHGAGPAVRNLNEAIAPFISSPPAVTRMVAVPAGTEHQGLL